MAIVEASMFYVFEFWVRVLFRMKLTMMQWGDGLIIVMVPLIGSILLMIPFAITVLIIIRILLVMVVLMIMIVIIVVTVVLITTTVIIR